MDLVACFDGGATCAISEVCVLQAVLHEALEAFLAVLDRSTLADLVAPRARLATLLGLGTPAGARGYPPDGRRPSRHGGASSAPAC